MCVYVCTQRIRAVATQELAEKNITINEIAFGTIFDIIIYVLWLNWVVTRTSCVFVCVRDCDSVAIYTTR